MSLDKMAESNGGCCKGCASLNDCLLSEVSDGDRCRIKEHSVEISLKKGQNIFEQDRKTQGYFCIRKGKVKLGLKASNDDAITLSILADKGMIGYHTLVSNKNPYTATCLTDTEVCFIPGVVISKQVGTNPQIESRIRKMLGEEYMELTSLVISLRSKTIPQRTAEILIKLQTIFGKDDKNWIAFEFTKEELANLIGSSTESVFRALSSFKEKEYIEFDRRKIKICNESKLRSIGKIYH